MNKTKLTRKQYYSRMSKLIKAGLDKKEKWLLYSPAIIISIRKLQMLGIINILGDYYCNVHVVDKLMNLDQKRRR
jgi:hypothetical protein